MMLARIDRTALAVTERIATFGVLAIVAVAVVTVADVLLREIFHSPIRGLNEITQPLMALGVSACIPAGVMGRVNITINAAEGLVSKIVFAWLRVLSASALFLFFGLVTARLWSLAAKASDLGSSTSILMLPTGTMLKVTTTLLALAVVAQIVPVTRTIADAFQLNRRVSLIVSAVILCIGLAPSRSGHR